MQTPTQICFLFLARLLVLHPRLQGIGLSLCRSGAAGQWGVRFSMWPVTHNISNAKLSGASDSDKALVNLCLRILHRVMPERIPESVLQTDSIVGIDFHD